MIYLVMIIILLLLIASIFVSFQIKNNPTAERLNNRKRLYAWWGILTVCLVVFLLASFFGPIIILLLTNALLCWVSFELGNLYKVTLNRKKSVLFIVALLLFNLLLLWFPQQSQVLFFVGILSALKLYLIPPTSNSFLSVLFTYCFSAVFSIYLISQLTYEMQLDFVYLLLILFFITAVNDIAQYIAGSLFGKKQIAPITSPNKTFAGVWGGVLVTSILSSILLPMIFTIKLTEAFVIGSIISLSGFFGDLIVSKLKRGLQVKDSGQSIIGHGGILDRLDSLMLIAPVFGALLWFGFLYE